MSKSSKLRLSDVREKGSPLSCLFLILLIIVLLSCSTHTDTTSQPLRTQMNQVAKSLYTVSSFAWTPSEFYRPENHYTILHNLRELEESFHAINHLSAGQQIEPGFAAVLESQNAQLLQIRSEFMAGQKRKAGKSFRSLSSGCIACHSRIEAKFDFVSKPSPIIEGSIEDRLAAAEFLFATRQFELASDRLFEVAMLMAGEDVYSSAPFEALKLWLVIELRVRNRPAHAAERLTHLITTYRVPKEIEKVVTQWLADLTALAKAPRPAQPMLREAQSLLEDANSIGLQRVDGDMQLVKLLRATTVVHQLMRGYSSRPQRCRGLFLLVHGYFDLPVSSLMTQLDTHLEQLFRECPDTDEAEKSLQKYQANLEYIYGAPIEKFPSDVPWKRRYEQLKALL